MAKSTKIDLKGAIEARSSNQRFPIIQLVRENPELSSVLSKLHKSREQPRYNSDGNREPQNPDIYRLRSLATNTANNITDSQTAMQILPDLELACQILISIILSPKDMMTIDPGFTIAEDITSSELSGKIINEIKSYFENKYDLVKLMQESLRDMLFETGSYPIVVIPENSIDYAINGYTKLSLESFKDTFDKDGSVKPLGLLGPANTSRPEPVKGRPGISLESFSSSTTTGNIDPRIKLFIDGKEYDTGINVIDNINFLKIPKINEKIREMKHREIFMHKSNPLNFSLESELSHLKLNDRELSGLLFKDRSSKYKVLDSIKTDAELERMMLGDPLIMHLPSEAVIPVYIPGSPEKHIGYFLLLDQEGNPLDLSSEKNAYKELSSHMNTSASFPSAMLQKVRHSMTGFDCGNRDHLDYVSRVYGEMIEADLLSRLRNGRYTNGVAIAKKEEIYRIMLARSFSNRHTQVLWIPDSLMTYFAIRFNANGVGKSLLDDLKIVNSLRAMTNMASVMALLKNSISRTGVRIKFEENDPNPQATLETVIHEILRSRQQMIPWGTINPADISDWFSRAGLEIIYEGHPGMPDVGIEFEDKSTNAVQPDTALMEELRKQTAMGLGLSPETIDATLQPEFATSIVTNNVMMSKRAMQLQEAFLPLISDHVTKVIKNTPSLLNDLLNHLYDDFDQIQLTPILKKKALGDERIKMLVCKQTLKDIVDTLEVTLPKPDNVSLENQYNALETMEKMVDRALDNYINSSMFNEDTAGDMGNKAETIKAMLKAYYMRKWMIENGILPELSNITTTFETGDPTQDVYSSQAKMIKGFIKYFSKFLVELRDAKDIGDKVAEKLDVDGSSGGMSDSSYDFSSDDDSGMDDFETSTDMQEGLDENSTVTDTATDTGAADDSESGDDEII